MHEMSLVVGILEIVTREARAAGARVVNVVEIEVGGLAGVEIPALEFAFAAARGGTPAADARLVIHEIPGRGRCPDCGADATVDFFAAVCPACGEAVLEITQGRELRVRSLNVD